MFCSELSCSAHCWALPLQQEKVVPFAHLLPAPTGPQVLAEQQKGLPPVQVLTPFCE